MEIMLNIRTSDDSFGRGEMGHSQLGAILHRFTAGRKNEKEMK